VRKFGNDHAGNLAALVAYYAFFSLFPLLLVMTTILGFILQGHPGVQRSVENSVLGQFPVIGQQIQVHALSGRTTALVIGLVTSLLGGLGVTQAAQNAFDTVWAVPFKDRPDFVHSRLRGLGTLAVLGVLQVISTVASGAVSGGVGSPVLVVVGIVVSLALNLVLFFAMFRLMTDASIPTRELWPGIIVAAILWEILQAVGGVYIGHVVKNASNTYGTFATVIGLIVWIHLGAQAVLYSAEVNTVLTFRLWPRSLFSYEREEDKRALERIAKTEEQADPQRVHVTFHEQDADAADEANRSGA
jgi:membrane protein